MAGQSSFEIVREGDWKSIQRNFDKAGGAISSGGVTRKTWHLTNAAIVPTVWPIDGNAITGVRISYGGLITLTGATQAFMFLYPNGASLQTSAQNIASRSLYDGVSAPSRDFQYYGPAGSGANIFLVGETDWVSGAGQSADVMGSGFLSTPSNAGTPSYNGQFSARDRSVNGSRVVFGEITGTWFQVGTKIVSLGIVISAGTFTGHITLEIIP